MTGKGRIIGGTLAAAALAGPMGAYYEGNFPIGYRDPVGTPTDCVGETGPDVVVGKQRFTFEQCLARYQPRLARNWTDGLSYCIHRDVTLPQGAALISFADNVGIQATCASTMVRMLNAGAPPVQWCAQMDRWNKATLPIVRMMIVLPGLTKRRASEHAMCLGNVSAWRASA